MCFMSVRGFWLTWALLCLALINWDASARRDEPLQQARERKFAIWYRLDSIRVDETYLDNAEQLSLIRRYLALSPKIDSITISSWASPEGVYEHNVWLARERGKAAKRFLVENTPPGSDLTADKIILKPLDENWAGLEEEIRERYSLQNRDRVMRILNADIPDDTKKWRLKHLDNGYTWHYIITRHMPRLRVATWICVWVEPDLPEVAGISPEPQRLGGSVTPRPEPQDIQLWQRQMILAARSNLVLPGLNFGVEVPIGRHFSVGADYYYPWWLADNNKYCHELLAWFVDVKWWPSSYSGKYAWTRDDKLKGHAIGAYAAAGYYDYQWRGSGYQGEFVDFGVDYTFAKPLGRKGWARLEFNIGVGAVLTKARHYTPTSDWEDLIRDYGVKNYYYSFFGPTRAGVSLVLPITVKQRVRGGAGR